MNTPRLSFWIQAIRIIPRLEKDEWMRLDVVSKWLVSTRFATTVLTFFSALISGLLALRIHSIPVVIWIIMSIGLVLSHATNNIINDLVDFRRGVDKHNYFRNLYGPQPVEAGFRTVQEQTRYAVINAIIAITMGLVVVIYRGGPSWIFLGVGVLLMVFYTYPLKYIGLGEVAVLIVWGPLMVAGGYYMLVGEWSWLAVWASLPYALGVTGVLMGKHIDKHDADKESGIHTLPVILGEKTSRYLALLLALSQYVVVAILIITGFLSPVMAIVLGAAPYLIGKVIPRYLKPRPKKRPEEYPHTAWPLWFVAVSFVYSRRFGGLYVLALIIDTILTRTMY